MERNSSRENSIQNGGFILDADIKFVMLAVLFLTAPFQIPLGCVRAVFLDNRIHDPLFRRKYMFLLEFMEPVRVQGVIL
ncbi:MAG: hypothetical protein ACI8PB_005355 [Desulforhopalus sp.]|jgi:hypothetical protein